MVRKALVTGATGFVGSNLVRGLLSNNWDVSAVVRLSSNTNVISDVENYIRLYKYDGSIDCLLDVMSLGKFDVVFHVASLFLSEHKPEDIDDLISSNILLGSQLVESMSQAGITNLVNTGTSWQHYENSKYSPVNLYAATKQAFEDILQYYVEAKSFKIITLKLFDTYGQNDPRKKILNVLEKAVITGEPVSMSPGEQLIDMVHIDDVVSAYLLSADRLLNGMVKKHESYGVSSGSPIKLKDLVEKYEKENSCKVPIKWGERGYREREVMIPWFSYDSLPGWKSKKQYPEK